MELIPILKTVVLLSLILALLGAFPVIGIFYLINKSRRERIFREHILIELSKKDKDSKS